MRPPNFLPATVTLGVLLHLANLPAFAQGWPEYAHDPQHTTISGTGAQVPQEIRWSTPVDLDPQYAYDGDLYIHYGTPVITPSNTLLLPVKTGASGGFQVQARAAGNSGAQFWTLATDYVVPPHDWFPIFGVTLSPNGPSVVVPAAGGTILVRLSPDSATGTTARLAFYGIDNYNADPDTCNTVIQICTPVSTDAAGNLYFGYVSTGAALPGYPNGLPSGLARISTTGVGSYVSAAAMAGDSSMSKVATNCAPAFSNDGTTLYVAVNNISPTANGGFGQGYLCALDSTTLARQSSVYLEDPRSIGAAYITDDSSATPTVGPDGDVYYGVLEADLGSNNYRGWMLHFSGDLLTTKLAGAFGWDDTASIVPVSAVPSYTGPSTYLLLTKYNNYAGVGSGDGDNRLALVDPNTSFTDPISGATAMNPFITVKGVTPDPDWDDEYPGAVREWCINSAAVDPANHCALVNSEDGHLYLWDFTKATDTPGQLSPGLNLAPPTGEAYTPTAVGPDGAVYAINDSVLYSTIAIPLQQPIVDPTNHVLTFSYLRASANATYCVQTSLDLTNWTTDGVDQGSGNVGQTITASVALGSETERFVRLVTTTP